jgi:moderate conductance mechanosensitive channel
MSLRETVLRDLDGTVWHVRNGLIDRVGNHSQVWSGAMVTVRLAHGVDIAAAGRVLVDAARQVSETFADDVLAPPELLGVDALDPDGVSLLLRVRTLAGRQFGLRRALLAAAEEALRRHDIALATPHLTIVERGRGPLA